MFFCCYIPCVFVPCFRKMIKLALMWVCLEDYPACRYSTGVNAEQKREHPDPIAESVLDGQALTQQGIITEGTNNPPIENIKPIFGGDRARK
jgi:hypothetical protein